MKNQWVSSGDEFRMRSVSQNLAALPRAVYKVQEDRFGFYMTRVSDEFTLPDKVYGMERPFIDRVKKSWANTKGNMGILLNGTRGTGKTVTAEILANELELPVIIINQQFEGQITDFINELQDDCVIFFDEYDKIFQKYSSTLLTVMDGVLRTDIRIMFLLTTNDDHLNDNMYQRPSRIRYIKTFGNMDPDIVMEIVDDLLIHKHLVDETVKFISELSIITMDLVKSIIQEVNIHNESPYVFGDIFNITSNEKMYKLVHIKEDKTEEVIFQHATIDDYMNVPFNVMDIGSALYMNGKYQGSIREIVDSNTVITERRDHKDGEEVMETRMLNITPVKRKHYSFIKKGL